MTIADPTLYEGGLWGSRLAVDNHVITRTYLGRFVETIPVRDIEAVTHVGWRDVTVTTIDGAEHMLLDRHPGRLLAAIRAALHALPAWQS